MEIQQFNEDDVKQIMAALTAVFLPQFERIQRGIDKLESAIDRRLCSAPRKQSSCFGETVVALEADSSEVTAQNTLLDVHGMIYLTQGRPEPSLKRFSSSGTSRVFEHCFSQTKQSSTAAESVVAIESGLPPVTTAETFKTISRVNSKTRFRPKQLQMMTPKSSEWSPTMQERDSKNEYLVGAIQSESSTTGTMGKFLEVQGMCGAPEIDQNGGESKTPKFDYGFLDTQEFESDDAGKTADDDSSLTRGNRSEKSDGEFNSLLEKASSSIELKNGSLDIPNSDSEQRTMFVANLNGPGKLLAHCSLMIDADTGETLLGDEGKAVIVEKGAIELDKMCREAEIFVSKNMFKQPTFDPIWDQFCEVFDKGKEQALRAKLFEEGEPDMIQIGYFYKSQLLAKEAIKVGKKKGRIWLSQNPCSGYILWRHGSLNWLGGNSSSRACFTHKVVMFPMVCFVDPEDVFKVVFQGLKVAISKMENCQKMAKAENCFVKPTLELNSRSMELIQVQSLPQNETRYVYVQREGIG
ncbi:unnamed protein product [Linum trigynum]|uniref:Uncharacterized protein n=1 Tax=Linum trigynum TaxID=586398 RepID=A0AAV2D1B6_9ROSI